MRIAILLLIGLISSRYCLAQESQVGSILQGIKQASLQRKCYYKQDISFGDPLLKVIDLLGEPEEKYSVESTGFYKYGEYAFGFFEALQNITANDRVALFDYFLDIGFSTMSAVMGNQYTVQAFPEYRTFTLIYKIGNIIFEFTPTYGDEIEKKLSEYDPLVEQDAYESNARRYVSKCTYAVLTVFEKMKQ